MRKEDPIGPREQLLSKVTDFLAAEGVRDISLRTLAAEIGTSQRMLHYHFGSREDVLAAVIESVVEADATRMAELFASTPDPVAAGKLNWVSVVHRAKTLGPLYFELASHAMHDKPYAQTLRDTLVERSQSVFEAAYRTVTDRRSARVLARLTVAVGEGMLFAVLIDGDTTVSDAAIDEFTTMIQQRLHQRDHSRR